MIQIRIRPVHLVVLVVSLAVVLAASLLGVRAVLGQSAGEAATAAQASAAVGTAFTYQGRLDDALGPVSESCDMSFKLYDAPTAGLMIGDPFYRAVDNPVPVEEGLFTVDLDFGPVFDGDQRYLEIGVLCPGTGAAKPPLETLSPRQRLNPAPYAMSAPWSGLSGVPAGFADGQDDANWLNRAAAPQDNIITTVDDTGVITSTVSVAIGVDGLPIISYYDDFDKDLKVLHCENLACTTATWVIVDSEGNVGRYSSIAIGADGLPIVSYYDATGGNLKVAHCSDVYCQDVTINTVDSAGNTGLHTSVTIGAEGLPFIVYNSDMPFAHRHARCLDAACFNAEVFTKSSQHAARTATSVTIGTNGHPVFAYGFSKTIFVEGCFVPNCQTSATAPLDASSSSYFNDASVIIGNDGMPLISYAESATGVVHVARCENWYCNSAVRNELDPPIPSDPVSRITIGADGYPFAGFVGKGASTGLFIADCGDATCENVTVSELDGASGAGGHLALTIGVDGLPLIVYTDLNEKTLKVVHCGNQFCTPYFRRR